MHKLANFHIKSMVSTGVIELFLGMREEKLWAEKPRYSGDSIRGWVFSQGLATS